MFQFIHAADLHLDSPLRGLSRYEGAPADAVRGAARQALDNLVTLALDEAVAFVLIAGDLYDGDWKDYHTGLFLISQLRRLRVAGIPVFIVSGNHDAENKMTRALSLPDNCHTFPTGAPATHTLAELGVAIHGQGYARRTTTANLAAGYPPAVAGQLNIGLLHTSVTGRPGHADYAPCTVAELRAKGYDYWALGHVHTREVLSEEPWIVFPGNVQGRHARETGPKGCTLVSVDEGRITDVAHHNLDVLRWARLSVDLSGAHDGLEALARVREALDDALAEADGRPLAARLTLHGACPAHRELTLDPERWLNEIRAAALDQDGGAVWIEKIQLDTRDVVSTAALAQREDALGELLRSILAVEADDAALGDLQGLFKDLLLKLPAPLRGGEDGLDLSDLATLRAAVEDAKELLVARLLLDLRPPAPGAPA